MAWEGSDSISPGGEKSGDLPSSNRAEAIANLVLQVMERRSRGEAVPDASVIEMHRELMPELGKELMALRGLRHARLAAMKAGPIVEPSGLLSESATEGGNCQSASIELDAASGAPAPISPAGDRVRIPGYDMLGEINTGGQGTVFKAIHEATDRVVAIKVIPGGPLISSRHRVRFEREAGILAALDHPRIVGILDRGRTADGSLYMVMDFIDGCPLDEYLQTHPHDIPDLVRLFADIAHAVDDAHTRGIVHRDLKPSNIQVDRHGLPHILDFGLARLKPGTADAPGARSITISGQIVGSLPWASPEQVSGHSDDADARSDVYAIGVMLYQALAGRFPYSVAGIMPEVVSNILHAVPAPPSHGKAGRFRGTGAVLDAIVLKALAKSPAARYATAGELAGVLDDYLAGRPVTGLGLRRPRWWRMGLTVAMAVAVCVSMMVWRQRRVYPATIQVLPLPSLANSIGTRLVRIPAGRFNMGSPVNAIGRNSDEPWQAMAVHRAFYLGATEVTQSQYRAVMGDLPCEQQWIGDDLPVQGVQWMEASEFCRRLSDKEGRTYRLPTELEWEYACRAGTDSPFGGLADLDAMGWFAGNSDGRVHRVASKSPNHWGLHDMHGNVREWCQEAYQIVYPGDAGGKSDRPVKSEYHVVRGGGARSALKDCRSACRAALKPEIRVADVGFRVVLDSDRVREQ